VGLAAQTEGLQGDGAAAREGIQDSGGPSAESLPDSGAGLLQVGVLSLDSLPGGQVAHQAEEDLPAAGVVGEEGGQGGGAGGGQGPPGPPDMQGGDVAVADVLLPDRLLRDAPEGKVDLNQALGHGFSLP